MNGKFTRWSKIAGIALLAMLMGMSALAESRHRTTTDRDRERSTTRDTRAHRERSQRAVPRARAQAAPERSNQWRRQRDRRSTPRVNARREAERRGDAWRRDDDRNSDRLLRRERWPREFDRRPTGSRMVWLDSRAPFVVNTRRGRLVTGSGTITRIAPYRGGYRVWLDGGRYSWYVPRRRWSEFPFRVGLFVRLGGFYGPLGYVDVYDIGGDPGYAPVYSSGLLHGVVERVDYWNRSVVILDDVSGRFIRVPMNVDPRLRDVHPGDWVEISGAWFGDAYFRPARLDTLRVGLAIRY